MFKLEDLLPTEEAARLLQVKSVTLRQWRLRKRGPRYVRLAARVLYPRDGIDEWVRLMEIRP